MITYGFVILGVCLLLRGLQAPLRQRATGGVAWAVLPFALVAWSTFLGVNAGLVMIVVGIFMR